MSRYLEEAAALLRKAAETNEKTCKFYTDGSGALNSNRERIAMKFAQLGAIERGILPVEMAEQILAQARAEASR
jgi:transposase-like protein